MLRLVLAVVLSLVVAGCGRGNHCRDGSRASTNKVLWGIGGNVYSACNRACHTEYREKWDREHPDNPFVCQCSAACPCWKAEGHRP